MWSFLFGKSREDGESFLPLMRRWKSSGVTSKGKNFGWYSLPMFLRCYHLYKSGRGVWDERRKNDEWVGGSFGTDSRRRIPPSRLHLKSCLRSLQGLSYFFFFWRIKRTAPLYFFLSLCFFYLCNFLQERGITLWAREKWWALCGRANSRILAPLLLCRPFGQFP